MKSRSFRTLTFINRLKMKHKIILAYVLISLLPISALNLFVNNYTTKLLLKHETTLINDALQKAALQANTNFETYNTLSNYIFSDSVLLTAVTDVYEENYYKMYRAYTYSIEPRFLTYYALHSNLRQLTIYTESDLSPLSNYVTPLDDLKQEPWYDNVKDSYTPRWFLSEEDGVRKLLSVRRMMRTAKYNQLNYVYMEIDYDSFFSAFENISTDPYGLIVMTQEGEILFARGLADSQENAEQVVSRMREDLDMRDQYLLLETACGLGSVTFFQPTSSIVHSVQGILRVAFLAIWLVLVIIGLLAILFATILVKPLEALTQNMLDVQKGDLTITVATNRSDEVGILVQSFIQMISQLKHLIEVVFAQEIERKKGQLQLLYAQMNPHFLYNALSLINSKALISGNEEIGRMARLISSFYRTSLNQGQDTITIESELTNLSSYIEIQRLLNDHAFEVHIDTDPALLCCRIPHFILQPIVENAIDHGLMNSERDDKLLTISGAQREGALVFMVVDNGAGMPVEDMRSIFLRGSKGYGMKNVDSRLTLLYGENYTFTVESECGAGTRVTITFPKGE